MENKNIELRGLCGEFDIKLYGPNGILKDFRHIKNLTTNSGFGAVIAQMGTVGTQPAAFTYCAVGTGAVAAATTDETLGAELHREVGGFTASSSLVWRNDATFAAAHGTGAITESGLFNGASPAVLLCRQTFAVINKGADDTLVVTWQYTLS